MTTRNEVIGTVECPAKGCELIIPVYRFKARPTERMQRFANKLYCRCPKHGQFGGAAGDDAMQDYITENSTKCASENSGSGGLPKPAIQQELPAQPQPEPSQNLPAVPATSPATAPAQQALKKSGWFGLS